MNNLQPSDDLTFDDDLSAFDSLLVNPMAEMSTAYYSTLEKLLYNPTINANYKGKIVYTAMRGVGANYVDRAFSTANFQPVLHVKEQRGNV